jgi:hypothetical protein
MLIGIDSGCGDGGSDDAHKLFGIGKGCILTFQHGSTVKGEFLQG